MKIEDELQTRNFRNEQHKATLNIMFSASWLRNQVIQALKPYQLSPEQFNVLRILRGSQPGSLCLKDITCRMLDRSSNTTRIIEKLEQKALVKKEQSAADRREVSIRITQEGLELLAEIDRTHPEGTPFLPHLSEIEANLLNALLDKMRND